MIKSHLTVLIFAVLFMAGCSKEPDKPNAKFLGTYQVNDVWGSSKSEIGSGRLQYVLTIKPDGDSAVIIDNINKTLMGVKASVRGDSLFILKQNAKSSMGSTYEVDPETGVLSAGKNLTLNFTYNDLYLGNGIGLVVVTMDGVKDSVKTEK